MRKILVGLAGLILAFVFLVGCWRLARSRTTQLFGSLIHRVETDRRVIALTFDDGPTADGTRRVLEILDSLEVKATFFLTGSEILANPAEAKALVSAGHELGNHSFSHRRMVLKTPGFVREELAMTDRLIRDAGQVGEIFFRPPFSKKLVVLPWVLARTNRISVTWDVEPESYPDAWQDADAITRHALEDAGPGSIVLLHVMYPSRNESLRALPRVIIGLRERGFEFLTLGELLNG